MKYKLLETKDGQTHFAAVAIEIDFDAADGVYSFSESPWVKAAIDGASKAKKEIGFKGSVVLTEIEGTVVDTTNDDVSKAAYLAVWKEVKERKDYVYFDPVQTK